MRLNDTEELITDIREGRMVILMDDEDRENEGDLVMGASHIRPQDINFMARYGRGLICLTLTREHCRRLNLPLMSPDSHDRHSTNFTVSIEAAHGVTTGISAADRCVTIQTAIATDCKSSDLLQPGHVFPLMARDGGVLSRAGHTEAGCDLSRLAGLIPAAVIVEILNDDGSMARRADLETFAKQHELKIGTIADLIRYRIANEKNIERLEEFTLYTEYGEFTTYIYQDVMKQDLHFALVKGTIKAEQPTLVRVQLQNPINELISLDKAIQRWSMGDVLKRFAREENGVIVYLCNQYDRSSLLGELRHCKTLIHSPSKASDDIKDLRSIGLGAHILSDIGIRKMRVLSTPKRIHALSGFGLEVVEYTD